MTIASAKNPAPLDWDRIDTVLLDMDGTLLDLYFDNHFWLEYLPQCYAARHGVTEESARSHLVSAFAAERGTLNWYCVDYWSEQLQLDIGALKREVSHLIAIRPHVEEFLARLHVGREVWLVTNAHRKSLHLKLDQTGIDRWFHKVVSSHDYRAPKEDQAFWRTLQLTHPFDPARALLIDDSAPVLAAAHRFGIGQLLTMLQPDSRQARREQADYPGIHHFDEIMPP